MNGCLAGTVRLTTNGMRDLAREMEIVQTYFAVTISHLASLLENHLLAHLNSVQFMACKLYHKAIKKLLRRKCPITFLPFQSNTS